MRQADWIIAILPWRTIHFVNQYVKMIENNVLCMFSASRKLMFYPLHHRTLYWQTINNIYEYIQSTKIVLWGSLKVAIQNFCEWGYCWRTRCGVGPLLVSVVGAVYLRRETTCAPACLTFCRGSQLSEILKRWQYVSDRGDNFCD